MQDRTQPFSGDVSHMALSAADGAVNVPEPVAPSNCLAVEKYKGKAWRDGKLTSKPENSSAGRDGDTQKRGPPLPPTVALTYTINDAVKVSGLSRSSLYNLIAAKKLRSVMVAGRRLIPADALRDLLGAA